MDGGQQDGVHESGLKNLVPSDVMVGNNDEKNQDSKKLKLHEIIERESTNIQPAKLALNWSLIIILLFMSLMKGSSNRDTSLLKIVKCETVDWILFAVLQVICLIYLFIGL